MSLTAVKVSEEVWFSCLNHALTTETEEILGLLLGDIKQDQRAGTVEALVWGAVAQARVDRRKDRVETTPEQLAAASAEAERMTRTIGNTTRVIGWYHSHPHITVLPSHVDVRSQGTYQMLDSGFVGLIFSCFNEDANMTGRIQAIAFQSVNSLQKRNTFRDGGSVQFASAQQAEVSIFSANDDLEKPMGEASSSSSLRIMADENHLVYTEATSSAEDDETIQLSPSMQQAMHLSSLDMSVGDFTRKEIPLEIVPVHSFKLANNPPDPLLSLQQTLFDEEKSAFSQGMRQSQHGQTVHSLASLHHSLTYQTSLCRLMEFCLSPAMSSLYDRIEENKYKLAQLKKKYASLQLQQAMLRPRKKQHFPSP